MRISGRDYVVDWGHLTFLIAVALAIIWYVLDARRTSLDVDNLLMIEPTALFALILCGFILPQCFQSKAEQAVHTSAPSAEVDPLSVDAFGGELPTELRDIVLVVLLLVAFVGMVVLMNYVGFDVAIWLFSLSAMAICGERRALPLLIGPVAVTLVAIYGFRALIPYPIETVVL